MTVAPALSQLAADPAAVAAGRRLRARRRTVITVVLAVLAATVAVVSLMVGNTFYGLDQVIRVILGETVPGASFTVGELRLPRVALGILVGFGFGIAGVTFQTMLRNPLASPDMIGISKGASAAAVLSIVVLGLDGIAVSLVALGGALATAIAIWLLSHRGGFAGTRLILIGIGLAAMLDSVITYALSRAATWDLQGAMLWLTGSLNPASWERVQPIAATFAVLVPLLLILGGPLDVLRLGDESAAALGVRVRRTRLLAILAAVLLVALSTAAAGPIAFVALMSGPIAARIVGPGGSLLLPAGLIGTLLVLVGDLVGQHAFGGRLPVGVITGVLGAPYLIFLLVRANRSGGTL
ncbi:iron chelate uptake ABC transporter family permease subunit [Microbacterium sp. NPDC096154]|uniref:FecCD family ABC transporter permease n=1 Tax=Microbacterium sp. NPDC096154 TaxID=3155549 RepID=UPI003333F7D6